MLYKFYQKCDDGDYQFSLDFEKDKCTGIMDFNFPKNRNWSTIMARITNFIDFNSLNNTINNLKTINFVLQQKKNYVKLYCDIYEMIFSTKEEPASYKVPTKETGMLHTCLSCDESEATKLFNYFFVCQEYWAKPKSISVFCKNINEIRRLMTNPKMQEPNKIAKNIINQNSVVYLTDITEMSLETFEFEFSKFNRNNPKPLKREDFIEKFGFTVLQDKVLLPRKK